MSTLERYFQLVDILRESRRAPSWKAESDRPILAQLEDWYVDLSRDDQASVEAQGWRAWPDLFDKQQCATRMRQHALDAADDGAVHDLPRVRAA